MKPGLAPNYRNVSRTHRRHNEVCPTCAESGTYPSWDLRTKLIRCVKYGDRCGFRRVCDSYKRRRDETDTG